MIDNDTTISTEIIANSQEEKAENSPQSGDFLEKSDKTNENATTDAQNLSNDSQNVQKSSLFGDKFDNKSSDLNTISSQVSEFSSQINVQNLDENSKILSQEEDNALFSRLFPGVKRENVEKDPNFKLFADGKSKNKPFCSLYGEYLSLVGKIREEITMRGVVAMKNKLSSPGPLSSEESPDSSYFTREQVLKMSKEQIARNYNKIRESQQKW